MDRISAFMDGETGQHEGRQALIQLKQHHAWCGTWATFHLIRDVLRGDPVLRDDFAARFHDRLQQEVPVLAPHFRWRKTVSYALSAAASIAAAAVVVALVLSDNTLQPQAPIAAAPRLDPIRPAPALQAASPLAGDRGGINGYLMAHQEFSPSTAFQGVAPYVRTVSTAPDGTAR